jgi:hypothetical protein
MHLPLIRNEKRYKRSIVSFGGLNLSQIFQDGEMRDCTGISHGEFPFITQRKKRNTEFECTMPTCAVFGKNECIASEEGLYYNRRKVGDLSPGKKQIAVLGSNIMVFPDKVCYNTESEELTCLEGTCHTKGVTVTFTESSISVGKNVFSTQISSSVLEFPPEYSAVICSKATVRDGEISWGTFSLIKPGELTEGTILFEKCRKNQYRIVTGIT